MQPDAALCEAAAGAATPENRFALAFVTHVQELARLLLYTAVIWRLFGGNGRAHWRVEPWESWEGQQHANENVRA
jgi:hypothetical protein